MATEKYFEAFERYKCARKRRFKKQSDAARKAAWAKLKTYKCRWCGGWHLAKNTQRRQT